MATTDTDGMLSPDDLNDLDVWILDFLTVHEWASVELMRAFYIDGEKKVSRQWIASRVTRLREHSHLSKVKDTSTYQLVDDPRE